MSWFPRLRPRNEVISTSRGLEAFLRVGMKTWAGMDVTPETAVTVATVFACVRVISEDIGKLPFVVNMEDANGDRKRASSSPYWRLVHDRVAPGRTSQMFREYLTACALLRGNGFALKSPPGGPMVRELLPISPDNVRIEELEDFEVLYHVRTKNGSERTLTRREVFHLPGFCLGSAYSGVSIVSLARQGISLAMATERHGATLFGNGLHPGGVFRHPKTLSDLAQKHLKESLRERVGGDNSNAPLILEEGMDWTRLTLSNEDSQFLGTREFSVVDLCRWFRVPPHKVADMSRATFSNIEHQSIEYVTDTLMPWARRWEDAFNQGVIVTNGVFAELVFDALLRGDTKSRYESMFRAVGGPWMLRNEARRLDNLPPLEGGDELLEPANYRLAGEPEPEAVTGQEAGKNEP